MGLNACCDRPGTITFGSTFELVGKVRVEDGLTTDAPPTFGIAVDTLSAFAFALALLVPSPFVLDSIVGDLVIVVWP